MTMRRRLECLEAGGAATGCDPDCHPQALVFYHQDGLDGEPTIDEGLRPPATCPRCGRPARVLEMVVVYDPEFCGNADRLGGGETDPRATNKLCKGEWLRGATMTRPRPLLKCEGRPA
jgi:hypothetical protein